MFRNYFTTAYRNLLKHKTYSAINVMGLVVGLTSCILILLYVLDELNFDRWLPDAEKLYRYDTEMTLANGNTTALIKSVFRVRRDLTEYYPEIEAVTRLIDDTAVLGNGEQSYFEKVWFVDETFLQVFDLRLISGDKTTALRDKASILLSESMAVKYFGIDSPLGQVLRMDEQRDHRVVGVFEDIPQQSHLDIDFLVPYDQYDALYSFGYSESWDAIEPYTYLKLADGIDARDIEISLPRFLQNYYPAEARPGNVQIQPRLTSVFDIHLDPGGAGNMKPPGNRQMVVTLSLIALLVLIVACINFVNLSTIRAMGRAKEISIRKVVGAQRNQLTVQLMCETVLISLIALAVSIGLVELLLPAFAELLDREITVNYFSNLTASIELAFVVIVIGITSGLYPALQLSRGQPATALRTGGFNGSLRGSGWVQFLLVTLQFAISIALVITTAVIFTQQLFIDSKELGFSPENKLIIRNMGEDFSRDVRESIATELGFFPAIDGTAFSVASPSDSIEGFTRQITIPGYTEGSIGLSPRVVDANFFSVYDIPVLRGREFSDELRSEKFSWESYLPRGEVDIVQSSVVLNMAAIERIGFKDSEEAVGKTMNMGNIRFEIIGVVDDFHFRSLRSAITPDMYIFSPEGHVTLTVSYLENADIQQLLADVTNVWDKFVPGFPISLEFAAANMKAQYASDRQQFLLMTIFSSLAIAIACLGLFALAAYSTQQKTREIGIRKIHGALSSDIVRILLLRLSRPILIASFLAWPAAFYAITQYLNGFQYRIELGPMIFVLSSLAAVSIAWLTIIYHAIKSASRNPVDSLRYVC